MGRDATIDYNDVSIVANAIHAIATRDTARNIRSEIDRGTMATILAKMLNCRFLQKKNVDSERYRRDDCIES
jgi:hypothetical protein